MPFNETIDNHLITQFSAELHTEAQQMQSRLRPYVPIKKMDSDVWAYDGIGIVEAREIFDRYPEAKFDSIEHKRRKITRRRFVVNLPVDDSDVRGALMSPQNQYAKAAAHAMARVFDKVVIEAATADVKTGRDFDTTLTFSQDGGQTVTATGGLTYEKLLEINQNFSDNDLGLEENMKKMFLISGDEETALMKELELTSGDFSRQYAIDQGELTRAMGFDMLKFAGNAKNPLLPVSGGVRQCLALVENAVCVAMSKEFSIKIQERNDYIETTQVQIVGQLGAVRTEGVRVQIVNTTD